MGSHTVYSCDKAEKKMKKEPLNVKLSDYRVVGSHKTRFYCLNPIKFLCFTWPLSATPTISRVEKSVLSFMLNCSRFHTTLTCSGGCFVFFGNSLFFFVNYCKQLISFLACRQQEIISNLSKELFSSIFVFAIICNSIYICTPSLIDWLFSILRRIGNIPAMLRQRLLGKW